MCHAEWAERVNSCKALEANFACLQGCADNFFGSSSHPSSRVLSRAHTKHLAYTHEAVRPLTAAALVREWGRSDLPAYNSQREECLINNAPRAHAFSCAITYDFSRRLCPCGA